MGSVVLNKSSEHNGAGALPDAQVFFYFWHAAIEMQIEAPKLCELIRIGSCQTATKSQAKWAPIAAAYALGGYTVCMRRACRRWRRRGLGSLMASRTIAPGYE